MPNFFPAGRNVSDQVLKESEEVKKGSAGCLLLHWLSLPFRFNSLQVSCIVWSFLTLIAESDCLDEYGEQKGLGRYRFIDHVIDEPFGMPEIKLLILKCPFRGSS